MKLDQPLIAPIKRDNQPIYILFNPLDDIQNQINQENKQQLEIGEHDINNKQIREITITQTNIIVHLISEKQEISNSKSKKINKREELVSGVCYYKRTLIEKSKCNYFNVEKNSVVLSTQSQSIYLLEPGYVSSKLFGKSKSILLHNLIMFGDAESACELCSLNHWDQTTLPIHILKLGLQYHQISVIKPALIALQLSQWKESITHICKFLFNQAPSYNDFFIQLLLESIDFIIKIIKFYYLLQINQILMDQINENQNINQLIDEQVNILNKNKNTNLPFASQQTMNEQSFSIESYFDEFDTNLNTITEIKSIFNESVNSGPSSNQPSQTFMRKLFDHGFHSNKDGLYFYGHCLRCLRAIQQYKQPKLKMVATRHRQSLAIIHDILSDSEKSSKQKIKSNVSAESIIHTLQSTLPEYSSTHIPIPPSGSIARQAGQYTEVDFIKECLLKGSISYCYSYIRNLNYKLFITFPQFKTTAYSIIYQTITRYDFNSARMMFKHLGFSEFEGFFEVIMFTTRRRLRKQLIEFVNEHYPGRLNRIPWFKNMMRLSKKIEKLYPNPSWFLEKLKKSASLQMGHSFSSSSYHSSPPPTSSPRSQSNFNLINLFNQLINQSNANIQYNHPNDADNPIQLKTGNEIDDMLLSTEISFNFHLVKDQKLILLMEEVEEESNKLKSQHKKDSLQQGSGAGALEKRRRNSSFTKNTNSAFGIPLKNKIVIDPEISNSYSSSDVSGYCMFTLYDLLQWGNDTNQRIIIDQNQQSYKKLSTKSTSSINTQERESRKGGERVIGNENSKMITTLLNYMITHNQMKELIEYCNYIPMDWSEYYKLLQTNTPEEIIHKYVSVLISPDLLANILQYLPYSTHFMKEFLLNQLALRGIFIDHLFLSSSSTCSTSSQNQALLYRFTKTNQFFFVNHSFTNKDENVSYYLSFMNEFLLPIGEYSFLHKDFLEYLYKNNYASIAQSYIEHYSLKLDNVQSIMDLFSHSDSPTPESIPPIWFQLLLLLHENGNLYEASILNAATCLHQENIYYQFGTLPWKSMISNHTDRLLIPLSTFIYSHRDFHSLFDNQSELFQLLLENIKNQFPFLYTSLITPLSLDHLNQFPSIYLSSSHFSSPITYQATNSSNAVVHYSPASIGIQKIDELWSQLWDIFTNTSMYYLHTSPVPLPTLLYSHSIPSISLFSSQGGGSSSSAIGTSINNSILSSSPSSTSSIINISSSSGNNNNSGPLSSSSPSSTTNASPGILTSSNLTLSNSSNQGSSPSSSDYQNFYSEILSENPFIDKIDISYFLQSSQPHKAYELYSLQKLDLQTIENLVWKIMIQEVLNQSVISSCIEFLEMLSISSIPYRINIHVALRVCAYLYSKEINIYLPSTSTLLSSSNSSINQKANNILNQGGNSSYSSTISNLSGSSGIMGSSSSTNAINASLGSGGVGGSGTTRYLLPPNRGVKVSKEILEKVNELCYSLNHNIIKLASLDKLFKLLVDATDHLPMEWFAQNDHSIYEKYHSRWYIVNLFAHLHSLPLYDAHLIQLATMNNWRDFLYESQSQFFSPEAIVKLVNYFTNNSIKEHTMIVLNTILPELGTNKILSFYQSNTTQNQSAPPSASSSATTTVLSMNNCNTLQKEDLFDLLLQIHQLIESNQCQSYSDIYYFCLKRSFDTLRPILSILSVLYLHDNFLSPPKSTSSHLPSIADHPLSYFHCLSASVWLYTSYYLHIPDPMANHLSNWIFHHTHQLPSRSTSEKESFEGLLSSMNKDTTNQVTSPSQSEHVIQTIDEFLLELILFLIQQRKIIEIKRLFQLFDASNVVLIYLQFHHNFLLGKCEDMEFLFKKFINELNNLESNNENSHENERYNQQGGVGGEMSMVNKPWITEMVRRCLHYLIQSSPSPYEKGKLLNLLFKYKFKEEFVLQYQIYQILERTNLTDIDLSSKPDEIINLLIENNLYKEAREFSQELKLNVDKIIIHECNTLLIANEKSTLWENQLERLHFWEEIHDNIKRYSCSPPVAAEYFYAMAKKYHTFAQEHVQLLSFALEWYKKISLSSSNDSSVSTAFLNDLELRITILSSCDSNLFPFLFFYFFLLFSVSSSILLLFSILYVFCFYPFPPPSITFALNLPPSFSSFFSMLISNLICLFSYNVLPLGLILFQVC